MFLHNCFLWICCLKGCDGSVLLSSKGSNKAEKDGPPNISLHAFYVIDNAKKEVEASCPGVVSCADILALAARDAVVLVRYFNYGTENWNVEAKSRVLVLIRVAFLQSGGPTWDVPKGRKDGRTSKASETIQLPAPTFNISQLQQSFSQRGLSMSDLVALSGKETKTQKLFLLLFHHFKQENSDKLTKLLMCRWSYSRVFSLFILQKQNIQFQCYSWHRSHHESIICCNVKEYLPKKE